MRTLPSVVRSPVWKAPQETCVYWAWGEPTHIPLAPLVAAEHRDNPPVVKKRCRVCSSRNLRDLPNISHTTLSLSIAPSSERSAITAKKHCVVPPASCVRPRQTLPHRREVALAIIIIATTNCCSIAANEHNMIDASRRHIEHIWQLRMCIFA